MATRYLPLSTKQAALVQSEDWWNKVLGRAKFPQDVTRFLAAVITNPLDTAQNYVVTTDAVMAIVTPLLTVNQLNQLNAALLPESDPNVQATLAALHPPLP